MYNPGFLLVAVFGLGAVAAVDLALYVSGRRWHAIVLAVVVAICLALPVVLPWAFFEPAPPAPGREVTTRWGAVILLVPMGVAAALVAGFVFAGFLVANRGVEKDEDE